jgi:hypothetical protein
LGRSFPEFKYTYSSSQTCWSSQKRKGKCISCIYIWRCTLKLSSNIWQVNSSSLHLICWGW